ncbi:hypothetical protein PR202_gb18801 [Eleusine coracana subsp. coracana]|uniref:Uncharacterized protein n=1 Tax=Eleusine coracana subsp. coracana TaxID=191504 RepID=A0AAV5F6J9_ELECO|nr:hypothetical protein PR202_gb18801 [Eleusine coracana subsp. coracana]
MGIAMASRFSVVVCGNTSITLLEKHSVMSFFLMPLFLSLTEVSDQNFADDEVEVDVESSKGSKKKRFSSTETLNDQVNSLDQSA